MDTILLSYLSQLVSNHEESSRASAMPQSSHWQLLLSCLIPHVPEHDKEAFQMTFYSKPQLLSYQSTVKQKTNMTTDLILTAWVHRGMGAISSDRQNKIVDSARFMHFLASVEAVHSSNKHFRTVV